jgi:hypothetical protein
MWNLNIQSYLDFERKVFLHVLDDQDEEGQLYTERFLWVSRARYVSYTEEEQTSFKKSALKRLIITLALALALA